MGKSTPSAPATPDPYATASAQGQANVTTATAQTLLNNANQNTPYGTTTFAPSGSYTVTEPDGTSTTLPTFTSQTTLSAPEQKLFNQQNALGVQANNAASLGLRTANQALSNPVTAANLPGLTTSIGTPSLATGYDQGGAIQSSVAQSQAPTSFGQTAQGIQGQIGGTAQGVQGQIGGTQNGVQYFQPGDFTAARDAATNAALARLQPSMDQQNSALQASLANQGVGLGSPAFSFAMFNQAQSNNDLRLGAVATGDAEQQALFGQQATANQLYNAAQSQDFGQQQARATFANAAQSQDFDQQAQRGAFANAAQAQDYTQQQGRGQFAQQGVAQNNAANLAQGQFANSAQGQQNAENAAAAGFGNTAATQDYQNRLSAGAFGNQARDQSLNDQETLNNNIINQISSLMHGGQVSGMPQASYSAGTLDQTPLSSDVYQSAALQNQQYMAQLQASSANTAAMGSALGGIMGGFGRKSDRRLKSEVSPVARARNGLMIYRYRLATEAPGWHFGFMADEVALIHPEAVWTDPADGWARVDYDRAVA